MYGMNWKGLITGMLLAMLAGGGVAAQEAVTTQGRDFWLMFLPNYFQGDHRSIVVASEEAATVTIATPSNGWSTTVEVAAGGSAQVMVDNRNLGYHVTSTSDIAVYASNYMGATFDIATVYPTSVLRPHYIVQCYEDVGHELEDSQFGMVAVEDNTHVIVQMPSGDVRSFTMQAGQVELYGNSDAFGGASRLNGILTGTTIRTSDGKPLAVFQGNQCSMVGESACDHLYEQAVPTDYWGRQFIVVPIAGRVSYDVVKVTSLENHCRVAVNDTFAVILDAGESHIIRRYDAYKISTMKPVTVCLYMSGDDDTTHWGSRTLFIGDPSAVIIPPVEQSLQHAVFYAYSTEISNRHYANIVTQSCAADSMLLDGVCIGSAFTSFNDQYSYAQLSISPGVHTLSNSMGLFQAWFYGMGPWESYAYIAGMAMTNLDQKLYINSEEVTDTVHLCMNDSVWADLHAGGFSDTRWHLDGVELENTTLHLPLFFDSVGTHTLKALLHGNCCQQWCDSLEVTLQVHPTYSFTEEVRFCEGIPYPWHDTVLLTAGFYTDSLTTAVAGCDSSYMLHLEAMSVPTLGIAVEADCFDHTYRLTAEHLDTLEWTVLRWSAVPNIPALHGHEGDSAIELSPSSTTVVTLHAEAECPADSVVTLKPIVWPVARISVTPDRILLGQQTAFDAYDLSLDATGREWEVDGVSLGDAGNPLHYTILNIVDSVVVVLTAMNDYCHDTASTVVRVFNEGLYAPNVFTPEQGSNNHFTVYSAKELEGELSIYNREGLLVFRTTDLATGWDGQGCPQGAYVWHLKYRFAHTPERWHKSVGTVTLLR